MKIPANPKTKATSYYNTIVSGSTQNCTLCWGM